jgi:geranylgeranyl diphosphate synthase type 3
LLKTDILGQRTKSVEVKKYAVELMRKSGAFQYTQSILTQLESKAQEEIARLGGNDQLQSILQYLGRSFDEH